MASGSRTLPDIPGYAAFIVNIDFQSDPTKPRIGAKEDIENLQTVFISTLGLTWINNQQQRDHENLSLSQWDHRKGEGTPSTDACDKCLRCRIAKLDHSKSKCFVLAISSHGRELTETEIMFSDGGSLFLSEVFQALNDDNCPSLRGKPRIIILQVCRSNFIDTELVNKMQDRGVTINTLMKAPVSEQDGSDIDDCLQRENRFQVKKVEDRSLQQVALNKMPENYILVYPTVPGQRAKQNEQDGSWLINGLKKIVTEKYTSPDQPINFLRLLTQVSGHIARDRESIVYKQDEEGNKIKDEDKSGFKSAVCFHHRLVQPLVFNPVDNKKKIDIPIPMLVD